MADCGNEVWTPAAFCFVEYSWRLLSERFTIRSPVRPRTSANHRISSTGWFARWAARSLALDAIGRWCRSRLHGNSWSGKSSEDDIIAIILWATVHLFCRGHLPFGSSREVDKPSDRGKAPECEWSNTPFFKPNDTYPHGIAGVEHGCISLR